ncbi:MAG: EAL domain-containing protein [Methylobacteriaceae bacterium]|nr:EAL domain-containing protein [Methylobacteriaceae bacterium]
MKRVRSAIDALLSLGAHGLSPELAGRMRAAQIEAVRRSTPWMMAANVANALILLAVFRGSEMFVAVAAWATAVSAIAIYALYRWFATRQRAKPESASLRGVRRTVTHTLILSAVWSFAPMLFSVADADQKAIIGSLVAGMLCGAGFALATIPAAALVFTTMLAIGSVVGLALAPGWSSVTLALLNVLYNSVVLASSLALARMLSERLEAQMRSSEQRDYIGLLLNDFEEHASDWLWMVDENWRIRHVSSRLLEALGATESQFVGRSLLRALPLPDRGQTSDKDRDGLRELVLAMRARKPFRDRELVVSIGGAPRAWSLTATPVFEAGAFRGYRGVGRDVTQAREARRRIEYLARYDVLTDIANRAAFNDEIGRALYRLRKRGEPFAVLLLDLDHFKSVNDTQGHPVGDELLRHVARRLESVVREDDFVARLGGDEFAILLGAPATATDIEAIAARIVAAIAAPYLLSVGEAVVGVSIGVACASAESDVDTLIRHADLALYRAKREGRGRYCFFEPELDAAARRRHQIEMDLREAIETDTLSLAFQPLSRTASGRIVGFEALARWRHHELGPISPAEFIPLAEDRGMIGSLGAWVLMQACKTAASWPEEVRIAVNLSPVQFRTPRLFDDVRRALHATGLAPQRLELEVTESLFLDATPAVDASLQALRQLGVRVALDDFGAGYSSLSYLRRFRFDKLKIDRSFVDSIDTDLASAAIVGSIIGICGELDITVCVEGVETEGQRAVLERLGCDEVQGYLISRPVEAGEAAALLDRREVRTAASSGF